MALAFTPRRKFQNPRGYEEDESDYTVEELGAKANELVGLAERINQFLLDSGLQAIIEKNTELTSEEIEAVEGISTNDDSSASDPTQS